MSADAVMPVGIIVERRKIDKPWQDHSWRPIGVLPHAAPGRWRQLSDADGRAQFYAGNLPLELHRGETEGYLVNLSQDPPAVYIVLRQSEQEESGGLEVEPFLATVCPYEAMAYTEAGDEVVEGVPMPPEVMSWLAEFVQRHHVERPFQKRKNRRSKEDRDEPRAPGRWKAGAS